MTALVLEPGPRGAALASEEALLSFLRGTPREAGIAVDTETSSLAWGATVRLVQFGNSERGYAVDAGNPAGRALVANALDTYRGPLVFHNSAFDIHRLDQVGVDPEFIWPRALDTHVMAHVINPDRLSFKLKQLARVELGDESTEAEKALKKVMRKRGWTWATVPPLVLTPYGVTDTLLTHQLFTKFSAMLTPEEWEVVHREMEVRWAMGLVQWKGMRLDHEYALELQTTWRARLEDSRAVFLERWGVKNPNAVQQVATALIEQGWAPTEQTKTGWKLDKKILKELRGQFELVDHLLEHRRLTKWLSSYVDKCLEEVDENGYVHASYNTLGASTGRMSCSTPPLQQLPKGGGGEVRRLFIASAA